MAKKFTDLVNHPTLASGDIIPMVDISNTVDDPSGSSAYTTPADILTYIENNLTVTDLTAPTGTWTLDSSTAFTGTSATSFTSGSHVAMTVQGGNGNHIYYTALSGGADFTVKAKVGYIVAQDSFSYAAFGLVNTSGNKILSLGAYYDANIYMGKWITDLHTFSSNTAVARYMGNIFRWGVWYQKITRVSGTYTFSISLDGKYYMDVFSESSGTFLGDADGVGLHIDTNGVASTSNTTVSVTGLEIT